MGIEDYYIYDPGNDYPNKRRQKVADRLAAGKITVRYRLVQVLMGILLI